MTIEENSERTSAGSPIRVGLLGAGYILQAHAKALAATPGVQMVAVCDAVPDRVAAAAAAFGIPHTFTDVAELLSSDCEVVHVLLPPHLHVDMTRRILEAGKSAFVEKPMGIGAENCQGLVDLADSRGLKLAVNHNFLFSQGYERLRREVKAGEFGRLDHISIDWLYALGLLQFGPYNNWMLNAESNLVYELGPHLAAFVIDLVGPLDDLVSRASYPVGLPGEQRVWRHWNAMGSSGATSVSINLSVAAGQPVRSASVRGHAGAGRLDFDRDTYVREQTISTSTVFDPFFSGTRLASSLAVQAGGNVLRGLRGTLLKSPESNAFQASIHRSVAAFYDGFRGQLDARLDGRFGVQVMRLCERIVHAAGVSEAPARKAAPVLMTSTAEPKVLVVGGTGFIGKHLVKALVDRGVGVRVLSRSAASARLELAGLPVHIEQGTHDDPVVLERALRGIEVVYHLAKATGKLWSDYVKADVEPTRVLAEAALAHGIRRFIYTGTIDSYASADPEEVIDHTTPLDPRIEQRNLYARSKAACEELLLRLHTERGLPLVIFRPGVVIGAGSPPAHWGVGMFHSDTRVQFWGDGRSMLPLVLVDDVAEALALGMTVPDIEGRTFLLTDAPLLSARDYVAEAARASGSHITAEPTPIWRFYVLDAAKELVKKAIRHPNHRKAVFHDWNCRSHRARYENRQTRETLHWTPAGTRDELVARGIVAAVQHYLR